jgi:hypothetical protein
MYAMDLKNAKFVRNKNIITYLFQCQCQAKRRVGSKATNILLTPVSFKIDGVYSNRVLGRDLSAVRY